MKNMNQVLASRTRNSMGTTKEEYNRHCSRYDKYTKYEQLLILEKYRTQLSQCKAKETGKRVRLANYIIILENKINS